MATYAGDYSDRIRRHVCTQTVNPANGQEEETFTPSNYLWARIEIDSSRKQQDYSSQQTGVDATIYIRNYPTLSPLDRLYSQEWDELWIIQSIKRGNNELICDCLRFDELEV